MNNSDCHFFNCASREWDLPGRLSRIGCRANDVSERELILQIDLHHSRNEKVFAPDALPNKWIYPLALVLYLFNEINNAVVLVLWDGCPGNLSTSYPGWPLLKIRACDKYVNNTRHFIPFAKLWCLGNSLLVTSQRTQAMQLQDLRV